MATSTPSPRPPRTAGFYATISRSLVSEGYKDRRILRTFLADEQTDAIEVLLVAHGRYAETVWTDVTGVVIHGPIEGFGEGKTT